MSTVSLIIYGIEFFWSFAKTRLVKFKGIDKKVLACILKNMSLDLINRGEDLD